MESHSHPSPEPRRRRRPSAPGSLERALAEALERVRRLSAALARERGLDRALDGAAPPIPLRRGMSSLERARAYAGALLSSLEASRAAADDVPPCRAYCFRCESFLCAHGRQPEPREVVAGYEPTGRPMWKDLAALLFDRRDPRAEVMAERAEGLVTVVDEGVALTAQRIEAFGGERPAVEILGQVAAGPFAIGSGPRAEEGAISVQALRVRRDDDARLTLQAIGDPRLLDAAGSAADPDLARILGAARTAIETRRPPEGQVHAIGVAAVRDLARDLEHHFRSRGRRTLHARGRSEIGVRPTSRAFPDARAADDDAIRVDRLTGTFVLLAKSSRVHFFNAEGRHVTSIRFAGEAIRARVGTGRWREASPQEIAIFRARVAGTNGGAPRDDRRRE